MGVRIGRKGTCAVTACSFAHNDVAGAVVDDDADADEGPGRIGHGGLDLELYGGTEGYFGESVLRNVDCDGTLAG